MKFEPDEFKDEYKEAVDDIVRAKVEGKEVIEAAEPEAETTVVDLMAALKASVERAKKGEKAAGKAGTARRAATGRKSTAKKRKAS